jgi:hypothetical protein
VNYDRSYDLTEKFVLILSGIKPGFGVGVAGLSGAVAKQIDPY